jgi:peptidoglycan/LPS O-acetylase OafA/YrhL
MKSLNLPYNPRLDQLRWLAVTIVFLFHYYHEYMRQGGVPQYNVLLAPITEGHTGVGLFFALSGFLFMQIAQRQQHIVYRDFLRNRLLRIVPLFLVVFVLATSIGRDKFAPQDLLYVLATNLGLAPTSYTVVTGAAWSISVEFTFYLVFPFLARFALERGASYLLQLLGIIVFLKLAAYTANEKSTLMFFSTLVGRFDQFLIGMLGAFVVSRRAAQLRRHGAWLVPLALALAYGNSVLQASVSRFDPASHDKFWIFWSMLEAFGWTCLIVCWVGWERRMPAVLERVLEHGGKISFSFYLLHMAALTVLANFIGLPHWTSSRALDAVLAFPLVYGATWAISALSYHVIEQPFLRLRRSYGDKPAA